MKDYTKYDFAAIVGAKVEIETETYPYKGILVCKRDALTSSVYEKLSILEREGDHCFEYGVPIDEIVSLEATMKPKDMNQEQLHRLAEEIALEHYGDRYESIRSIYHYFDEDGELNDISVDARCHLPDVGAFVIDPNEPVDITHWLKEEERQ